MTNPALLTRQYEVNVNEAADASMVLWQKAAKANQTDIAMTTIVVSMLVQFKRHQGAWFRTLGLDGQQQLATDIITEIKKRIDGNADNRGSRD